MKLHSSGKAGKSALGVKTSESYSLHALQDLQYFSFRVLL